MVGPKTSSSTSVSGSSAAAAAQVRRQHVGVLRVQHGRLHRPLEQRLGVVDQVGVQRVVARRPAPPATAAGPPGPAGLLPQRGPGAGPAGEQHRVQAAHVDPELEGVGRGQPQQPALPQGLLEHAPVLGQVAPR